MRVQRFQPYDPLNLKRLAFRALAQAKAPADARSAAKQEIRARFEERFGELANDPQRFHEMMRTVYGDGYDVEQAEQLRQRALRGDFSWLPDIQFESAAELHGGNGAYDAGSGVVYLNEELANDPELLAQTYLEEAGHHLDTLLNRTDSVGDEGELFRRLMSGENLSQNEIAAIRAENDHATIVVNGKEVEVEFWLEDIGSAIASVGKAIDDGVEAVGSTVSNAVRGGAEAADRWLEDNFGPVGGAVGDVIRGAAGGVRLFGQGLGDIFLKPVTNLLQGKVADALEAPIRGLSRILLQSPERFLNGFFDGARTLFDAIPIPFLRELTTRGLDVVRTITSTGFGIADDMLRVLPEMATNTIRHLETALNRLLRGDFGGALVSLGWAAAAPFTRFGNFLTDNAFRVLSAIGNIVGVSTGMAPPARGLSDAEKAYLRSIYGDSVDLDQIQIRRADLSLQAGMRAHAVGNTIYLPEEMFNADGTLNEFGTSVLAHEAGHVWQAQNGGGDYMSTAVCAQCAQGVAELANNGDAGDFAAYDWARQADKGVQFDELTPEQQAELMQAIADAWRNSDDGDGVIERDELLAGGMSEDYVDYAMTALEEVRHGRGASIHGGLG